MTRECLAAIPGTSILGQRVARELTTLIARRGKPGMVVSDNDTELTSNAIFACARDHAVEWHYITQGRPMQNGFVESFNGRMCEAHAPFGHWATQTFIAGLRYDGLTAPWLIDRPMNRRIFETYVETHLAPTLQPGDVVILDNFSSHKSEKAAAMLKERGAWFLFLPPYNPDLNPIEMAFAELKAHFRRIGARTIDEL